MSPIWNAGASLVLCACLGACAASNPQRTNTPAAWKPPVDPAATAKTAAPDAPKAPAGAPAKASDPADEAGGTKAAQSASGPAQSGAAQASAPNQPPSADAAPDPVLVRVGGQTVFVSDLLTQMLYSDKFGLLDEVEDLVLSRLVYLEAQRLRVHLDPDEDERAYEAEVTRRETEIAKNRPGVSLDRYVDRGLGLDPIRYRERLREFTRRVLLGQRITRAWLLQQQHVDAHIIVTDSEADMKVVQQELADGAKFDDVARKHSIDKPSQAEGGAITPIADRDTPVGKLAFETAVGAIGGPILVSGKWLILRADARHDAIEGDWSKIGARVEESLKERPVDPHEMQQWRSSMRDRYEVDLRPFLDIVHEPDR